MNQQNKGKDGNLHRFLSNCAIRAIDGEGNERKFTISFSSEEPYERWWGKEILSHKDDALDLTRLNTIGCVLFNHDRDKVVGKVIRAWTENERGYAEIEFDQDPDAETIYQKVKSGSLKGVSVGYQVSNWEEVKAGKTSEDGRFAGPCSIAKKWEPFEVSIVSVPADHTVGVNRTQHEEVSSFYFYEKQLQINKNRLQEGKE
jgi:HK97 family phage prohead protease